MHLNQIYNAYKMEHIDVIAFDLQIQRRHEYIL